ncbi:MAG: hypothetical protein ACTSPN_05045 [Promethearchaeota archaeon]
MMIQSLSELAIISGFTAAISVFIGFFFGLVVLIKYFKTKQFLIFNFFLCIVFTLSPWFPSGLGYLYWQITGEILSYQIYVLLGTAGIPIAIIAWLNVYLSTLKPERKKVVLICYGIISLIFEIYLFYFLYFAPEAPVSSLLGIIDNVSNPTDIDYKGFVLIFLGLSIVTACVTGIHFAVASIKLKESQALKWKGYFLLVAFILFGISAIFDALIDMNAMTLIIIRIILVISNLFFYLGFILPGWVKKLLSIKESEVDQAMKPQ